jgi:phosphohistidine phosphatase
MKTLLLMRHGKSSWKHPELPDHDRPLAKNGLRDARRMGELIERRELLPQLVLSSSAVRAADTARIFCEICACTDNIIYEDSLYLAEADTYISQLKALPDSIERVMLVGHNPGLESLLQMLSTRVESLPTAVIAYITLPVKQWSEITNATEGELIEIWRPKEFPEEKPESKKKTKVEKPPKTQPAAGEEKNKSAEKKDKQKTEEKPGVKPKEKAKKKPAVVEEKKSKPKKDKKN